MADGSGSTPATGAVSPVPRSTGRSPLEIPMAKSPRPIEVLLVEDDPGDILLTIEAFEHNKVNNNLHVVNDGEQAMAFLRREGEYAGAPRPDLVLLDLNLPRKD